VDVAGLLPSLDGSSSEVAQVIALLGAAGFDEPQHLSVGDGDRHLLALYRSVTGEALEVMVSCPACGALCEAQLNPGQVPPSSPRLAVLGRGGGLREPTYADLLDLPEDPAHAVGELCTRCVVGSPARAPDASDLELVDDSLAGPILIACSGCGEPIAVDVDVEQMVVERLVRRAHEIDREIHALASAYHWSLGEIESLGEDRRHALADLIAETA
jgi:hypothetical protein